MRMTLRLPEEVATRLRKVAGDRGMNGAIVAAVGFWLEHRDGVKQMVSSEEMVSTDGVKEKEDGVKRPVLVRGSDLPVTPSLEGYRCSYEQRGRICGKPATYWRGRVARCEVH